MKIDLAENTSGWYQGHRLFCSDKHFLRSSLVCRQVAALFLSLSQISCFMHALYLPEVRRNDADLVHDFSYF